MTFNISWLLQLLPFCSDLLFSCSQVWFCTVVKLQKVLTLRQSSKGLDNQTRDFWWRSEQKYWTVDSVDSVDCLRSSWPICGNIIPKPTPLSRIAGPCEKTKGSLPPMGYWWVLWQQIFAELMAAPSWSAGPGSRATPRWRRHQSQSLEAQSLTVTKSSKGCQRFFKHRKSPHLHYMCYYYIRFLQISHT